MIEKIKWATRSGLDYIVGAGIAGFISTIIPGSGVAYNSFSQGAKHYLMAFAPFKVVSNAIVLPKDDDELKDLTENAKETLADHPISTTAYVTAVATTTAYVTGEVVNWATNSDVIDSGFVARASFIMNVVSTPLYSIYYKLQGY
jgi:hypothetical protein